jgi:hypothetical protein
MNRLLHSLRTLPLRRQNFRLRLEQLETRLVPAIIDHSSGFTSHLDLIANGSAKYVGSAVEMTDGNNGEAGSVFTAAKVDLANINTSFTFQFRPGSNPIADGIAFVIQGAGSNALGGGGGALGYQGINNSVAVTFHAFDHSFTELQVNGTAVVTNTLVGTGIDFNAGAQANPAHTYKATVTYSQASKTLNETLTDVTANVTKTYSYTNVDVAGTVGASTGYVGFTGGTGGFNLFGDVQSWFGAFLSYSSQTLTSLKATAPDSTAIGVPVSVTVSALDQNGNPQLNYTGTVHFTSSDSTASLPANYTFTAADNGQHTFAISLGKTGNQSITATDTGNASLTSTAMVAVTAGSTIDYSTGFASHSNLTANGSTAIVADPVGQFQNHTDIGTSGDPAVRGTAAFANGTYTLSASGTDIGFLTPDQDHFQYVYSQGNLSNTSQIIARVVALSSTDYLSSPDWTKAVIQVRTSLDPAAPNVTIVMSPHNESEMTWRDTQGGGTGAHQRGVGTGPIAGWIRLDRNGSTFTGYWATDNNGVPGTWNMAETHTSANIGNANVYVGIGLTAHHNGSVATAIFDNVTVNGFTPNTNPTSVARLTDGGNSEGGSLFSNTKVGVKDFSTSFTFKMAAGSNPIADGLTFTIQADSRGPSALGQGGGAMGYGTDANDGLPPAIQNSVAIKFDAYKGFNSADGNHSSTGLYINGDRPNNPPNAKTGDQPVDLAGSGIDFNASAQSANPHTFLVNLTYDGTKLTETIKDLTTNATFTTSYTVNLSTYVGSSNTAYVGFTGGTGGLNSIQDVQAWSGQFYSYQQTATSFGVGAPTTNSAGTPFSTTVTAKDQNGATMVAYQGTVHFTSSDNAATLPANYTFALADQGVHTFSGVKLLTSGNQTITATDTVTGSVTGSAMVAVTPGAALFAATGFPATITAGTAGTITITAQDASHNTVTGYLGTVHFTSNDAQAVLPADYTFTAADNGAHTFSVTLKTAGTNQSITVTDGANATGSQTGITVNPAATSTFVLAYPASTVAGVAHNFTVTAQDQFGNTTPAYTGTVHFSSSDTQAVLPADYMFQASDNGVHTFSAALKTAGMQSLTATDKSNGTIAGTQFGITVTAAAASTLTVAGFPSPATAGNVGTFTVMAKDPYGNTATTYNGAVHFTSSDTQATLPADYTFVAGDNGAHTFSAVLKTAGMQSITATDKTTSTITGAQSGIQVVPGAASLFIVAGFPTTIAAGTPGTFTVTAKDAYGNTATGYNGGVHFTSSDNQAVLPADYTFVAGDNGTHSFSATLKTAGSQSITATDKANSTVKGTQSGITVTPLAAATLAVASFPSPVTAGVASMFTVTAKDQYGNTAPSYVGSITFTSSDGQAGLPADYTFVASDDGVHTFSATLKTAGSQSITATDKATGTITGTQANITVNPAAAATLTVAGFPSTVTAGMPGMVTVTAQDAYGNTATGYTGAVHFTSSDTQVSLPADYTFVGTDNGTHTFSAILKTAGSQSITATDTTTGTITGTQSGITVNPAATSAYVVAGFPSTVTAGVPGMVTVTAQDAYGNITPAYTGMVHFTSSDAQAVLPADSTLSNGTGTFSVTLETASTQSITATDTANGSISGAQTGIVVTPAAASTVLVFGYPSPVTAGTAQTFTVTAKDRFGNTATGYGGTLDFTSSDSRAFLPADYTFAAADKGTHNFAAAFLTSGLQSLTATDTADGTINGTQVNIQVNPAGFHVTGFPSPTVAGTPGTFTVTAVDADGNVNLGYTGTVHFTSSDPQAVLPPDYTFQPSDNGVHTFSAALFTAGTESISVMDTSTSTVAGTQSGITITPADFSGFVVTGFPSPTTAGVTANFSVSAVDAYGNVVPTYTGTVTFSSSDLQASLPADYTFISDDQGTHFFTATLFTAGTQSITAADVNTGLAGTQNGIVVNPGVATTLLVTGYPSPTTAGTPGTFTVTVLDNYGNVVTNFTGTVHFTSTDPQAQLPADYTFTANDMGMQTFTATLFTAGTQSIAAADQADQLNGEQDGIVVTPAAASQIVVTGFPSPTTAGTAGTFTVTVEDAYGNVVSNYTGTVHFSSTDTAAILPDDYTFTLGDQGVHTFGAVLNTVGLQSIIATDTVTGITGEQDNIQVVAQTGLFNGPSLGGSAQPAATLAKPATQDGAAPVESSARAQPAEGTLALSTPNSLVGLDDFFAAFVGDLFVNRSLNNI